MGPGKGSEAWLKFGQVKNLCQLLEPEGLWWDPELSIHSPMVHPHRELSVNWEREILNK